MRPPAGELDETVDVHQDFRGHGRERGHDPACVREEVIEIYLLFAKLCKFGDQLRDGCV